MASVPTLISYVVCACLVGVFCGAEAQIPDKDLEIIDEANGGQQSSPSTVEDWRASLPILWAILVGVNEYDDPSIRPLAYAVADVQGIRDVLADTSCMPYREVHIHLFTDAAKKKPTRNNIFNHLGMIASMSQPEDTILFFFSGHGTEQDGRSYLLPSDTGIENLARTALAFSDISDDLSRAEARKQVFILDACHSGGTRKDKGVGERLTTSLLDQLTQAEGRVVLSSCGVNQVSYEFTAKGHGVYTYYLMDAISGAADQDGDGLITVDEAHLHVLGAVRRWASEHSVSQVPRKDQRNVSDPIILTMNPNAGSPVGNGGQADEDQPTVLADYDGAEMALIPAGKFTMGSPAGEGRDDELPWHEVYLDAFYMDVHEVTNAQYGIFMTVTGHPAPAFWNDTRFNQSEQPVVGVSWYDAQAYATWVGRRLPTEAEWERAIRGTDRRRYPWGDEWTPSEQSLDAPLSIRELEKDRANTVMCGLTSNVSEWVADYYGADYYRTFTGEWRNPTGPGSGGILRLRVIRGGAWNRYDEESVRCAFREKNMPNMKFSNVGFRLAMSP